MNNIDLKLDNIIDYIKNTKEFTNYLKAKELMDRRLDLKELIENIRILQKKLVKNPSNKEIKQELETITSKLESDMTYIQYQNYLSDINNLLTILENKLNKYFEDLLS